MLNVAFENLDELREVYSPEVLAKATKSAMDRLSKQAATEVSKAVRGRYPLKAGDIKRAFKSKTQVRGDNVSALMIYTSPRIPLSQFAGGKPTNRNRVKVKTPRGTRYAAKVRVVKSRPARIIPGAFWARAGIFQRKSSSRLPIKQLTGPGISHMVRTPQALKAIEKTVNERATKILSERIGFYSGRKAGTF